MSKIEWTEHTSNPIYIQRSGGANGGHWCAKVSEGCLNCYAEQINSSDRFAFASHLKYSGQPPNLILDKSILDSWTKAKKSKLIFPFSMTDWCGEWVSEVWSFDILDAMAGSKHIFQTLTKRADRLKQICDRWLESRKLTQIPPNIWLGVSAENQRRFDERIEFLVDIPCSIRWISCEPLLGEIILDKYIDSIQWVVVGGESGKNARRCDLEWITDLVNQCEKSSNTKCFVKQLGAKAIYNTDDFYNNTCTWKTKHPKGGDIDEFPEYLKVRNLPIPIGV